MKIAIFTELYYPSIGGQEIRFQQLGKALAKRGHDVSVYCVGHAVGLAESECDGPLQVFRHPMDHRYKIAVAKIFRRSPISMIRYGWWCRRVALSGRFDLCIYNQWPLIHLLLAPDVARRVGLTDWCEIRNGLFWYMVQSRLPRIVRFNMAVSQEIGASIKNMSGCRAFCVPSGVAIADYQMRPRGEREGLLYLGRIAAHKNVPMLISAFAQLAAGGYRGRLRIAGEGPALEEVRAAKRNSPVSDYIDLLGSVSDEQKVALLAQCELVVMPSKREGFPRVVAEAMASGVPTVTAEFPENGTAAVVRHYECGVVTAPNVASFVGGIQQALDQWETLSNSLRRRAHELDWSTIVDDLERQISI